jgi:diguanylate cyclase (GGDEF)-like protein
MLPKLRNNFKLALIVLFGVIAVMGVTPFAIYRFAIGQPLAGTLDLLILLCIGFGSVYAWRTGRTEGAARFAAVTYTTGCIAVAHVSGLPGLLWLYPVLLANFLLVGRGMAVIISAIAIVVVAMSDTALASMAEKLMFVSSALVTSLFAYVLALRSEEQRLQLESIAAHDPLTGAYNRRGMDAEMEIAISSSMRNGSPLGLLVFDLDHFKQINDSFGHEAGDAVLVRIAELTRRSTRRGDRFFRSGGEEFGLLVPGADSESLRFMAEKLRATVEDEVSCNGRAVTVSIGATWLVPGESAADFLSRADAAMYRAKHQGRNRVVVEETRPEHALPPMPDHAARRRKAGSPG